MSRKKLSRRQFVAATALTSAAMITAPYVRGAHAAGKLSIGFWDHWVPGANKASTDIVNAWAEKEKVEVSDRLHPEPGQQEPAHHRRRSAGEIRPRHSRDADLVAACAVRAAGAHERCHGRADQAERRAQRHREISRPVQGQVARGARQRRQPDQGSLLAHRPDEEARRHRRSGDVSGRRDRRRPTTGPWIRS